MKKQTAMALAAVFAMSVAGTALAAPANPFVDVPAKHWAYDSVNKLAKSGVISGYGDGTFKGDKTLTRYEIAVIVGKAMANSDKMDAETKKALEALKAEFGTELNNLGVRVDNLEKNASKIKFTGQVRERYEWTEDGGNENLLRLRLMMTAPVADGVTFKGRLATESAWGTGGTVALDQAYLTGKVAGVNYNFGRQPIYLGKGLLADTTSNNDGLVVTAGKDVKVTAGAFKKAVANYTIGNISADVAKNLNVTASYIEDKDATALYETTAAGISYNGFGKFAISGEFAKNDVNDIDAKATMAKVKYGVAKANEVNSFGAWVGYRQAEAGFDIKGLTTYDFTAAAGKASNDVKGYEYGIEYTVFKNGVLTLQYNDMKNYDETASKENLLAYLVYTF
ncbi:S-layer homology domain-containing protein [Sporomusa malonica]|uniref:S-layer homology domain-containing protein n=1 Tax=Sporomusa malonica TaxID=112901 RepID=A0A1W1YRY9_9FIRM|nr:S-layer homology domain-containing protein [Sporomusa malonica]SMC38970.1 S-layer homology domain-containing protein [Sporomusa malonica]